jgi:hypothetical protein
MPKQTKPVSSSPKCILEGKKHTRNTRYYRVFTLPDGTLKCAGGLALPDEARREGARTMCKGLELDEETLKQGAFLCSAE